MKVRALKKSMDITTEILKSCMRDDRKAINHLYEYGFNLLMPICFRYNKNEEDARSSYNVGFLKILNGLPNLDEKANFNAWARRIMVNSLIDEYRKNKRYTDKIMKSDDETTLDYYSTGSSNEAESNMGVDDIMQLVKELPSTTAIVFNLYVIEGYAHKEIAEQLDMSEGTSKWHLSTARKLLREKLESQQNQRMVI